MEARYEARLATDQTLDREAKLGPYQSLALLAVPVFLVEPLKLVSRSGMDAVRSTAAFPETYRKR